MQTVPIPALEHAAGIERLLGQIDAWLGSDVLLRLVHVFGGPIFRSSGAVLARDLDTFAADHWDFRRGAERDFAARAELSDEVSRTVVFAAEMLGLLHASHPLHARYDALLVLGGLVRACVVRPRFAATLVREGLITPEIVGLGSLRPLGRSELVVAGALGIKASDEYAALCEGVRLAFDDLVRGDPTVAGSEGVLTNSSWRESKWTMDASGRESRGLESISIIAAPSSDHTRRANTGDCYRFWANRLVGKKPRSILVVTHPIYAVYQGAVAIQHLGLAHGFDVETVGLPSTAADLGSSTQTWSPQNYLQEIRSSISALARLRQSLEDVDRLHQ